VLPSPIWDGIRRSVDRYRTNSIFFE